MLTHWDASKKRTHLCKNINSRLDKQKICVNGWIKSLRDHGFIVFVDLVDETGLIQIAFNTKDDKWKEQVKQFHYDAILSVTGLVSIRPKDMHNKLVATGHLEILPQQAYILSKAALAPFQKKDDVNEQLALKYRYLDFKRRPSLKHNLQTRHKVLQIIRQELSHQNFCEIETPILYKSTPEGARDYLVPSNKQPGYFYALPQSPQILKQMLMMGSWEKYFQIARCFRDEDLRSNRQPEFTQLDIEMSFIDEQDIMSLTEALIKKIWKHIKQKDVTSFPVLSYKTAMSRFGTDKPDLRNPLELKSIESQIIQDSKLQVLSVALHEGSLAKSLFIPKLAYSRSQFDKLQKDIQAMQGKLVWIQKTAEGFKSPLKNKTTTSMLQKFYELSGGDQDGVCFVSCGLQNTVNLVLSHLISRFGKELNLIDTSHEKFVWITDFPYFEFDPCLNKWTALHHPFSLPKTKDLHLLELDAKNDFSQIQARSYDLICNGHELAGGSLRAFYPELQKQIFSILGFSEEQMQKQFGFLLEALSYGAPPHGGIAWGIERLVMILTNTNNIKDVMAFPKSSSGACLLSQAPTLIDPKTLSEYHLSVTKNT